MTENKRFTVEDDDAEIWEDDYFIAVACNHTNTKNIAKKLNKLAYGNKQLKKQLSDDFNQSNCITVQKSIISDLKKENDKLKKENDKLKTELFEVSKELLLETSSEIDRILYCEDEIEELRKEIFK